MFRPTINIVHIYLFIPFRFCSDGRVVPSVLKKMLEWEDNYPDNTGNNSSCIVWKAGKLLNTRCDNVAPMDMKYLDGLINTSYTPATYHRGYLCEARPIHTVALNQKTGGELCHFPFRFD